MSASPKAQSLPSQPAAAAPDIAAFQRHKWIVAIAVMLGTILETLDTTIINVALPHMQGSFSASIDEITWVVTSYLVANGIMIPMTGWISARFGRKRYFLLSVAGFVLASAACGAARSLNQIVFFRLVQGLAGAAMQPSSQAILMETFPPEEQAMAMAFWGIGMMAAPIMGPTIGGWITDNWSWRWNFYVNIPVGIAAIVMVTTFLHDPPYLRQTRSRRGGVDYPGIALIALSLGLLQLVLDRGQRADWFASPWVTYATVGAVASLVLLVVRELKFSDPILDLRILKIPAFTIAIALQVMMSFTLFGVNLMNPVFLQEFMGYTAWQAGIVLAPRGLGAMFAMLLIGQLERWRIKTRPLMAVGYLLQMASLWSMAHWNLQIGYWQIVWAPIMMSGGFALFFPPLSAATLSCVERERMGYAASLFGMIRNTGAAVGVSVMSTMLVNHQQIHQSYLGEHLSVFDAWRMGMMPKRMPGSPGFLSLPDQLSGHKEGLAAIYHQFQVQAAMLSLNDIYWMLIWFSGTVVPVLLVLWLWQSSKAIRPQSDNSAAALAH
ncbi:MAG TPA: DHA2 family efflux MFS transporter permease subunit [Candidatus Binataceae bacterium]|nr:DHA2 family efflux MFS transporter permease subunit [Candidatus Binataceae bacterium]